MKKTLFILICLIMLFCVSFKTFAAGSASDAGGNVTVSVSVLQADENGQVKVIVTMTPKSGYVLTAATLSVLYDDMVEPFKDAPDALLRPRTPLVSYKAEKVR